MRQFLNARVVQHPDKTFIDRITKGFDILGYWFSPQGLEVATKSVGRRVEKMTRLGDLQKVMMVHDKLHILP